MCLLQFNTLTQTTSQGGDRARQARRYRTASPSSFAIQTCQNAIYALSIWLNAARLHTLYVLQNAQYCTWLFHAISIESRCNKNSSWSCHCDIRLWKYSSQSVTPAFIPVIIDYKQENRYHYIHRVIGNSTYYLQWLLPCHQFWKSAHLHTGPCNCAWLCTPSTQGLPAPGQSLHQGRTRECTTTVNNS